MVTGCTVDTATLALTEQQKIQSYLDVCRSESGDHNSQARDAIQYEITTENQGTTETFLFDDVSMPAPVQDFIEFLTSKSAPTKP